MVENIVGKGENAGYQHFLLYPQCFQMLLYPWGLCDKVLGDGNLQNDKTVLFENSATGTYPHLTNMVVVQSWVFSSPEHRVLSELL